MAMPTWDKRRWAERVAVGEYHHAEAEYIQEMLVAVLENIEQRMQNPNRDRISSYCPPEIRYPGWG